MTRFALILVLLFLFVLPVLGQDTTPAEATPAVTIVAAPATATQTPNILSLTLGELLSILIGSAVLLGGIGKILWDGNQPGQPGIDARLTTQVNTAHADREWIDRLERAYALVGVLSNVAPLTPLKVDESVPRLSKAAIDALVGVLTNIAPLTPIKVDDAVLRLLKDVQQAGEQAEEIIEQPAPALPSSQPPHPQPLPTS